LGDAGSLLLGTIIALYVFHLLSLEYELKPNFAVNKALLAIVIVIYPLIDLLRVFIIRIAQKKSPFHPDKNHLHHLLLKKGISHFWIVIIIQLISLSILFFGLI
jgi:UDP-GlcNAc:undecaprenyl-phosphate GlcNAc-1-phosphate transferase